MPEVDVTEKNMTQDSPKVAGEEFTLPGGILMKDGTLVKSVTLVEMTGQDEENISKPHVIRNGGKVVTALLANCMRVNGKRPGEEVVRGLLIGDRDFLMLKLRQISLGNDVEVPVACPSCGKKFEARVDLNDIEVKSTDNPHAPCPFTLKRGFTDEKGTVHADGEMRLPTGVEQEFLSSDEAGNRGAAATALLTRCCARLGTLKAVSANIVRSLSFTDRQAMANVMSEKQPGPIMDLSHVCPHCSHSWVGPMAVADFFAVR